MMEPVDNLELLNKTIYNRLNGVEGQDFHIQCEANGDQQTLLLTIKVRNKEVAQGNQSVVHTIKKITRDFDNSTVQCAANNSYLSTYLSTKAYIYLSRKYTFNASLYHH